ncbi:sugar-binding protein [uncultured Alistipes sp.]|uniref:sugar-binding protein n=1 Tax=uncultured Alistipes sp. TaxID=538949 RepID=UPI002623AAFE|nr:sugar-binding protein [uncultured Alistipes sp.]
MKKILISLLALGAAVAASGQPLFERYKAQLTEPRSYDCFRTEGKMRIDGRLDEAAWRRAVPTAPFVDIRGEGYPEPVKKTSVRMLWDDRNLYIGAELEEDDIVARLTQRDTIIYHDNDFEVFIDPDGDGQHYFEIENNARGVVFDLMLDKPYRSGGSFFIPWNCEGLQLAVHCDGTLNKSKDKDRRWFVEMAIPFAALKRDFNDPRDYKVWRINFSRVQWLHQGQPEENWVWSPTGRVDMHMPDRWGFLRFVDAPVGARIAPEPMTLDLGAYKLLWAMFYAQLDNKAAKNNYLRTVDDFLLTDAERAALPEGGELAVEATSNAFLLSVTLPARGERYTLDENGCFRIGKIAPRVVKNWMWMRLKEDWSAQDYRAHFAKIHAAGISGVLFEGYDETVFRLCKEVGLEAHYWKWTMNRRELLDKHPEWFAVNRKGESCHDRPAYVDYYRFLCPSHPEVAEYLAEDYLKCANLPYVDGMHLDYVRFPDVVLPVSLWKNYGIEQTHEMPEYDYCYCDLCRERFKAQTGRDPLELAYPMEDQSWINYRLDGITRVVKAIAARVKGDGKFLSGAVFPGPSMARRMVRQDWGNWPLDAYFPMIYNGFYYEGPEWIGRSVAESVKAVNGRAAIYAGLMFPDITGDDFEKALDEAYDNGASGVSFFDGPDDEYLVRLKAYLDRRGFVPAN